MAAKNKKPEETNWQLRAPGKGTSVYRLLAPKEAGGEGYFSLIEEATGEELKMFRAEIATKARAENNGGVTDNNVTWYISKYRKALNSDPVKTREDSIARGKDLLLANLTVEEIVEWASEL